MPAPIITSAPLAADAQQAPPLALSLQILRFKAKAMRLREELEASDDEQNQASYSSGAGFERRMRRRVSADDEEDDDECTCGRGEDDTAASPEDEFRAVDGGFKLPRLLHPVLTRQHAVLNFKREPSQMPSRVASSPAAPRAPAPSRVLPCVVARAVALRFVQ